MSGAIPPFPNMLSWRGAQLKKAQGQLYLNLLLLSKKCKYFHNAIKHNCMSHQET